MFAGADPGASIEPLARARWLGAAGRAVKGHGPWLLSPRADTPYDDEAAKRQNRYRRSSYVPHDSSIGLTPAVYDC